MIYPYLHSKTPGEFIREARKARGWSQQALGMRVGYDRRIIANCENDKQLLTASECLRFAKLLRIDSCLLLKLTDDMRMATVITPSDWLAAYRERMGLTQRRLADIAGYSVSTVINAEEPTKDIKRKTYRELVAVLDEQSKDHTFPILSRMP